MRDSLQNHDYLSMASFEKDFYELLNNGRVVTMEASQVRGREIERDRESVCEGGRERRREKERKREREIALERERERDREK